MKSINLATLENRKKAERKQLDKAINDFRNSKTQGMLGRMFASKTEEEKKADEEEIDEFIRTREKKFKKKYERENGELLEQDVLISLDNVYSAMPDDYFQYKLSFNLKSIKLKLIGIDNNKHQKVCTITTGEINLTAEIGDI